MVTIDGRTLRKTPLAEGGEAIIIEYDANSVLKVFKDSVNKAEKLVKVQHLLTKNLPANVITPKEVAYNSKGEFIGYIMDKVCGTEVKFFASKKFLKANNVTVENITTTILDIVQTLATVHQQNVCVGDLNDCNILFDKDYRPYFVDVDSWTVDGIQCTVAMDSFKDPKLVGSNFSPETDAYSFAVMAFKCYARMHPFGGTTNPDISILDRMQRGLSVIDNPAVTIPMVASNWKFLSPILLSGMKNIFDKGDRKLLIKEVEDFAINLKHCSQHGDFYYGKYSDCPVCTANAKLVAPPSKTMAPGGIPYHLLFSDNSARVILTNDLYITNDGRVIHRHTKESFKYELGMQSYFSDDGIFHYYVSQDAFQIIGKNSPDKFIIQKLPASRIVVKDRDIYYVSKAQTLTKVTVGSNGNAVVPLTSVAFRSYFEVYNEKEYFVCNEYDNMKIINVSGYNYTLNDRSKVRNYGIHFDAQTYKWLLVLEDENGNFKTMIFDNKGKLLFVNDAIKYSGNLADLCFHRNLIFKCIDGAIRGFSYEKNECKDFPCPIVFADSGLEIDRSGQGLKFYVLNDKEIYLLG